MAGKMIKIAAEKILKRVFQQPAKDGKKGPLKTVP